MRTKRRQITRLIFGFDKNHGADFPLFTKTLIINNGGDNNEALGRTFFKTDR